MKKVIASILITLLLLPQIVTARIAVWDAGHATSGFWSEATNWSDNTVPADADSVYLNATATRNCTLDVSDTINYWRMEPGFTGLFVDSGNTLGVATSCSLNSGGGAILTGQLNMTGNGRWYNAWAGTFNATNFKLYAFGNDTIHNTKSGGLIRLLSCAYPTKMTVLINTATLNLKGAGECLEVNGGTYNYGANGNLSITQTTSDTVIKINSPTTFTGVARSININADGADTLYVPSMTSTGGLSFAQIASKSIYVKLLGDINLQNLYFSSGINSTTIYFLTDNKRLNISTNFQNLRASGTNRNLNVYLGNAKHSIGSWTIGTVAATGIDSIFMETSIDTIKTLILDRGNSYVSSGTSKIVYSGTTANHYFKSQQLYYDLEINKSSNNFVDSTPGGIRLSGEYSVVSGATNLLYGGTFADDAFIDGSGVPTIADTIRMNGPSSTFHVGNTAGTPVTSNMYLRMNTATAGIIDDDKSMTYKQFILGDGANVSFNGGTTSIIENSNGPAFVSINGGSVSGSRIQQFHRAGSGFLFEYKSSTPTWAVAMQIRGSADACSLLIPKIKITGANAISILSKNIGTYRTTVTLLDTLMTGGAILIAPQNSGNTLVFRQNGAIISAGTTFSHGSGSATSTYYGHYRGTITVGTNLNTTDMNVGTIELYDTAQWYIGGNLTWKNLHTHNIAAGNVWTITGNSTITNAGKFNPDSLAITAGTSTLADNPTCGAINVAGTATFVGSGDSITVERFLGAASTSTLTFDAASRLRLLASCVWYMGNKTWPMTYTTGLTRAFDGGVITSLYMGTDGGDSLVMEPAKRYTFSERGSLRGTGYTRNAFVSATPFERCTVVTTYGKDTVSSFYSRDVVYPNGRRLARQDSSLSGGGGY